MGVTPIYVSVDLGAAGSYDGMRVLAIDKVMTEKTCRAQGWEYADGPRTHTVMCYYAYNRAAESPYPDYDTFMNDLVDYSITTTRPEEADEDPTDTGPGHWPN